MAWNNGIMDPFRHDQREPGGTGQRFFNVVEAGRFVTFCREARPDLVGALEHVDIDLLGGRLELAENLADSHPDLYIGYLARDRVLGTEPALEWTSTMAENMDREIMDSLYTAITAPVKK